ncbi:unnamed protein product [Ceratitis capitata]|uniref:(Mediterranean fruit fly) hypothetical protein n=1 Tax=Ceratitis capitata TaxID=7213 RepID=A0A811U366_CERCA|nr:unnamed protein product [Ceratitis capitata]
MEYISSFIQILNSAYVSLFTHTGLLPDPSRSERFLTLFDPYTALTPPTLPSPHSVTSATTPSTVSLSSPKVPASAPLEANTIESATVESAKEDSHEIASPDIQPPPPSDVLIKGFSIPTFLPPFPKFAMADLPAFTSPPTIPRRARTNCIQRLI